MAAVPAVQEATASGAATEVTAMPRQLPQDNLTAKPTPAPADADAHVANGRIRRHQPKPVVRHAVSGQQAINALGRKLPTVAARTGWSTRKLRSVLAHDDS